MASAITMAVEAHFHAFPDDRKAELLDEVSRLAKEAREAEIEMLRRLFPTGSRVRWKVGHYFQAGVVQQHNQYENSLWATNELTNKRVKVTAYAIREALKDG